MKSGVTLVSKSLIIQTVNLFSITSTHIVNKNNIQQRFDQSVMGALNPLVASGHFADSRQTYHHHHDEPSKIFISPREMIETSNANVGVAIEVDNFSDNLLGDPYHYVKCGWEVCMM